MLFCIIMHNSFTNTKSNLNGSSERWVKVRLGMIGVPKMYVLWWQVSYWRKDGDTKQKSECHVSFSVYNITHCKIVWACQNSTLKSKTIQITILLAPLQITFFPLKSPSDTILGGGKITQVDNLFE